MLMVVSEDKWESMMGGGKIDNGVDVAVTGPEEGIVV
jgi:hypothetical protein